MERFALIGVSHRRGGAAALDSWQEHFAEGPDALAALGLEAFVAISTCNRWDLAVHLPEGLTLTEARRRLTPPGQRIRPYAYLADGAVEQLTRIAASLDSLNPGEDQIMAQVRNAYRGARERGTTDTVMSFAFDTALRIAKRVRREVALAPVSTSLYSLARPALERVLTPGARVAVVGAGEMGALAAEGLAALDGVELLIVNRTPERARRLAGYLDAGAMTLDAFLAEPPALDALVCATPVPRLLDAVVLSRIAGLALIVDLGVPRNVAPGAAGAVPVVDVDSLQAAGVERREALAERLADAERIVQRELDAALDLWTERQLGPSIRRLTAWYLDTIGDALPPDEAAQLARKFAHVPIKGLRALAREHGLDAARTFLAETGLAETGLSE